MATSEGSVVIPVRLNQSPPPRVEARYDVSDTNHVSKAMVQSLAPSQVVVLGYWPVPDQSSPKQLREQFEDEARASLEVIRKSLEDDDSEAVSELSFTKNRDHLIDRVANKYGSTAVLFPGTVRSTPRESVLVLLTSDSDMDRIVTAVGTLFGDSDVDIMLFHAVERGDDVEATKYMLRGVANRLADHGISSDRIQLNQSDRSSRVESIVSEVSDHDLVVLSESEPTVRDRIFGPVQSSISDKTDRPSLTIRAST
ncbi:universal stress protein [Salinibaculum salinum]|uniref:universal stress protein n=1 Tax=Salinibaculum salinum TaxID=3131996 RepID=UPI0030ED084F